MPPGIWQVIADRGGWALAGLSFLLVFFGLLVPRRTMRDRDAALAHERSRNDNLVETIRSLLAYAKSADEVLQVLRRRAERDEEERSS